MSNGTPPAAVIDIEGVTHTFHDRRALRNISFQVHERSLHGFVGPNGAGKTTALRLICTLLEPQSGSIRVFGRDVVDDVKIVRRRLGFMPDHFSMYRQMTVYEYLDFFGAAYGLAAEERERVIHDVLSLTDMDGRKEDVISSLSRGMQQRVSLARVLVPDPDLLLLDEPASGLDPRARLELMEVLRALQSMGKTILISSHILSELADLCDSVTIIDRGAVKYSGTMKLLLTRDDQHPVYRLAVGTEQPEITNKLRNLTGVMRVEPVDGAAEYLVAFDWAKTDVNTLLRDILDLNVRLVSFSLEKKHLNQAFMDLTERGVP